MTLRRTVLAVVAALALLVVGLPAAATASATAATATAAAAAPSSTALEADRTSARAGETVTLTARVTDVDGTGVGGLEVVFERSTTDGWAVLGTVVSRADGTAERAVTIGRNPAGNRFRARAVGGTGTDGTTYDGSQSGDVPVTLLRRDSTLTLTAPRTVVDEQRITLGLLRRAGDGQAVPGPVTVQRRAGGRWVQVARVRLGADGRGSLVQRPRVDTTYRAVAPAQPWVRGATSNVRRVDNLPPGAPVVLPAGAPRPRITLPPQPRATAAGAAARVTRIPDGVWRHMVGRSWHRGCPVGRAGLRLVRVNYWGFDGYRHRGEVVVAAWAAGRTAAALTAMHDRRLPIRSMYRVDRFGWSRTLRGADDYRSMAADNTSGFNCRGVVGNPRVRSPHAYGGSVDVNPWENPYLSRGGWTPNRWWVGRSHPRVAWRSRSHAVVATFLSRGFRWTYGVRDAHHFDAARPSGRVVAHARCAGVCH